MELIMFSKMLQGMNLRETAQTMAELGFSGVDLTVRPGGHVEPETVGAKLSEAVSIFSDEGLRVPMITTGIVSASDPSAETVFETAASLGIQYIKLGYWTYKGFGTIESSIDSVQRDLDGLAALAGKTGVKLGLHTHSGGYVTADPMLLWYLIKDRDPDVVGAYLDPGHMFIEGGHGVWQMGLDLLSRRIFMVAVKDMKWVCRDVGEALRWQPAVVPMGQGAVRWKAFFGHLADAGFDGPVSIHSEYDGLDPRAIAQRTRIDLEYLHTTIPQIF